MERGKSDIDLQVANPTRGKSFIEWNVDMRVTVSSVKRSKMLQRSRDIFIVLLVIVFAVIVSHLKREVRALQVQMQNVNVNLLALMSKYDKLNRNLNRVWIQRMEFYGNVQPRTRYFLEGNRDQETLHVEPNVNDDGPYTYRSINPLLKSFLSHSEIKEPRENTLNVKDTHYTLESANRLTEVDKTKLRIERAILSLERQNTSGTSKPPDRDDVYDDGVDDLDTWKEPRSARSRRDEGRGKKRGKNKRRPKRSRRRLGPLVATFVGAIPEQHVTDTVYVGPWVRSTKNDSQYSLNKFHLVEDKKSIEVTSSGLYMISAQIFYFGEPTNYSYWILLSSEGKSTTQKLVKCSTASSTSATEVSCYTSVITLLRRGDRLHIQQQERDRLINMREGHSYIQLVLLSNNVRRKRVT